MDVGIFTTLLCSSMDVWSDAAGTPVVPEAILDESYGHGRGGYVLSVKLYEKCYGDGYAKPLACEHGYACVGSKYYSYCAYASDHAEPNSQCGGGYWYGPKTCGHGYDCVKKTPYYSYCAVWNDYANTLEQCGGKGWQGATHCHDGYDCHYQNDYYSHYVYKRSDDCSERKNSVLSVVSSSNQAFSNSTIARSRSSMSVVRVKSRDSSLE